jgi:hypothetical protein
VLLCVLFISSVPKSDRIACLVLVLEVVSAALFLKNMRCHIMPQNLILLAYQFRDKGNGLVIEES